MPQSHDKNRRIVLAARPKGEPDASAFRLEEAAIPEVPEGSVLVRTEWLSLDPYMRGRMSDAPSYAPPVGLGEVMVGGTVGVVEVSRFAALPVGARVVSASGWQDFAVVPGTAAMLVDPGLERPSLALGALGMPGFTAYMGLFDIGRPREGETVVVGAATGAVGAIVGQLAKLHGCRVVGVAGGPEKCAYAREELGFDACLDHRAPGLAEHLGAACPRGVDVYFENVGGALFDAVLPLLNPAARVPVCGLVSAYNAERLPDGPDRTPLLMGHILRKRLKVQGFIISQDYAGRMPEFLAHVAPLVREGKLKTREHVIVGLENAPAGLVGVLRGENFGKAVVKVA